MGGAASTLALQLMSPALSSYCDNLLHGRLGKMLLRRSQFLLLALALQLCLFPSPVVVAQGMPETLPLTEEGGATVATEEEATMETTTGGDE